MMKGPKKALRELVSRLLEEGNSIWIPAEGYSMFPAIRPGEAILISPIPDSLSLREGEIIAWKRERDLVVHRIISIENLNGEVVFTTRGDSSMVADARVTKEILAGRVTLVKRRGKKIIPKFLPSIPGWKYRLNHARVSVLRILNLLFGNV